MPRKRTHPGEYLLEEYLKPLNLSARQLADALDIPHNRISDIVRERRGVTADTALRMGRYFGTTAQFWINLQTAYDLANAQATTDLSKITPREMPEAAPA
jgi:addiction module HigA family antidote